MSNNCFNSTRYARELSKCYTDTFARINKSILDAVQEEKKVHDLSDKNITLTHLELISSLGEFDYDPCGLQFHKTAKEIISLPLDGLKEPWHGKVWLNPPYSNPKPFMEKLALHNNGIALVLNSTDTGWFHEFGLKKAKSIFFLEGRPKFTRMDYSKVSIMRGVVLFAYGEECDLMLQNTAIKGIYVKLKDA